MCCSLQLFCDTFVPCLFSYIGKPAYKVFSGKPVDYILVFIKEKE